MYTLADWTWCHFLGAIVGVPLLAGAVAVGRVPLLGCMAACHCWYAIAGCHWCAMVGAIGGVP